jgi:rhamnosyltransferase subunit B
MRNLTKKILIVAFGSLGDIHPFVALAQALQREGLRPTIATSEDYRDFLTSEGVDFAPARPSMNDLVERLGADLNTIARRMVEEPSFLLEKAIFPFLPESYADALAACDGAVAVVAHALAFSARVAAEKARLPIFNVVLSPMLMNSAYDPPLSGGAPFVRAPQTTAALWYNRLLLDAQLQMFAAAAAPLRRLRRDAGLPKRGGVELLTSDSHSLATVGFYSPLLAPPQKDHPAKTLIAGHSFHDRYLEEGAALASELAAFFETGDAPVIFTQGSFFGRDRRERYRAFVDAARFARRRAVLLAHAEDYEALRELAAPDVFVAAYVRHSQIFSRACAVLHHGGAGTSGQAMRAGKPQIVTPLMGDQFDNALRLKRLGVARVLRGEVEPTALGRELSELLEDVTAARRAQDVAARISTEDGAAKAARAIAERLSER